MTGCTGPPPDGLHDRVASPPEREAALDDAAVIAGHLDRSRVAEEVWSVQHVDVQRVARDPLPAVQQPAQRGNRLAGLHPADSLDCQVCAGLVGDRADTADPGGDVRGFSVGPPAQEGFEESGWLVDIEPDLLDQVVDHSHVQGALALHTRQAGRGQCPIMPVSHRDDNRVTSAAAALATGV